LKCILNEIELKKLKDVIKDFEIGKGIYKSDEISERINRTRKSIETLENYYESYRKQLIDDVEKRRKNQLMEFFNNADWY
jgi:hypothetical protein